MIAGIHWTATHEGFLIAEYCGLALLIHRQTHGGFLRFRIFRCQAAPPLGVLIASGSAESEPEAIPAAESSARRCARGGPAAKHEPAHRGARPPGEAWPDGALPAAKTVIAADVPPHTFRILRDIGLTEGEIVAYLDRFAGATRH